MKNSFSFTIRVPGTSANLGPGFDIMGIALNVYNDFKFAINDGSTFITNMKDGSELPFAEADNLVVTAYKKYFSLFLTGKPVPGFNLQLKLELPLKGGLGSSASALVAGMEAGRIVHKRHYPEIELPSEREMVYQLALMEGHPDNTTPALLGGLTVSYFTNEPGIEYYKHKFPNCISLFAFIPDIQMCTNASRAELPAEYPVADVIFNMARIAAWYEFMNSGKSGHLQKALEDRLHTSYRIKEGSVLADITAEVKKHIIGFSLSGSGPTVLLYCQRSKSLQVEKKVAGLIRLKMAEKGIGYRFFKVRPDNTGTVIDIHS